MSRFRFNRTLICFMVIGMGFTPICLHGEDYIWPTDASRIMTSSFGEYRPGHIHAGLDIKTWAKEGYRIFAIGDGSIVRLQISTYGYGRALFLRLDNNQTVVYAHLSCFADSLERLINREQIREGRFRVTKVIEPGILRVKKGKLLGYTGSSGNGVPHLHFEIRDSLDRPFNPLFLRFQVEDKESPVVKAIAVSPLSPGSHVDGDFMPKVVSVTKNQNGIYMVNDTLEVWGRIGIAVSAFDVAVRGWNRFSPYRLNLSLDDSLIFTVQYDYFDSRFTHHVDLDRDYRLYKWKLGLFQKLYLDKGNELPFYKPDNKGAGEIFCIKETTHVFKIEVSDFFGNRSEVRGVLKSVPLSKVRAQRIATYFSDPETSIDNDSLPDIEVEKFFIDDVVRFYIHSDCDLNRLPILSVSLDSDEGSIIDLVPLNRKEFVGSFYIRDRFAKSLTSELYWGPFSGKNLKKRDLLRIFPLSPVEKSYILSPDSLCWVTFFPGSLYREEFGRSEVDELDCTANVIDRSYTFYPVDVPLKSSVLISTFLISSKDSRKRIGIYKIDDEGRPHFQGSKYRKGILSAWTTSLGTFTVLQDTVKPEILYVHPDSGAVISDSCPLIEVGFIDTLSGVAGEENYIIKLDGIPLIIEYEHYRERGIHKISEPLSQGKHQLDIMIRDRAGNVAQRRSIFIISSKK